MVMARNKAKRLSLVNHTTKIIHHIKNHTSYFFYDIINMKNFDPNKIKIDESLCQKFLFTALECHDQRFEILKN